MLDDRIVSCRWVEMQRKAYDDFHVHNVNASARKALQKITNESGDDDGRYPGHNVTEDRRPSEGCVVEIGTYRHIENILRVAVFKWVLIYIVIHRRTKKEREKPTFMSCGSFYI
jgi:hypothetical protein